MATAAPLLGGRGVDRGGRGRCGPAGDCLILADDSWQQAEDHDEWESHQRARGPLGAHTVAKMTATRKMAAGQRGTSPAGDRGSGERYPRSF
jgi:hypothetical protein